MTTIELVVNGIFILGGTVLLAITVRYPRTVLVEIPKAIFKSTFYVIKDGLFIRFFRDLFEFIARKEVNSEYRTEKKKYVTFSSFNKFLLTSGTNEEMVRIKIIEGIDSINMKLKTADFKFLKASKKTIIIPPPDISFHDYNYLIQFLADVPMKIVGLVENKKLAYTVYDDPDTTNLIGQTDQGEKFFISLVDNFDKRQFLRINNEIELVDEYEISRIKGEVGAWQTTRG